eukprot:TRINITY_DN645_c5_g1_i1.p1 TRINITY_DN645_c5_g1~~TRINITY_DN645_c5_g1_i1.p1  ORF type:complete len:582 (+),score=115.52 TRINITY_DN645_c5_g1_i1:104-1849(+)
MQYNRGLSLRELTKAALKETICCKAGSEWNILIYDDYGKDVIAPILNVGELRKLGVTLFLELGKSRGNVPDAPAVYLVKPTEENIVAIAQDCVKGKYSSYNINFTSPVSRKLLERFAGELQELPNLSNITVKDQFMSFVSPERDLFSLQIRDSYYTIGSSHTDQDQIMKYFDDLANGIVHVLLTLQLVPIVVSVRTSDTSQELARLVTSKIKDMLKEHYLIPPSDAARPVLILCDRNADLATGLVQPFTYRALLHDSLGMRLNKVVTPVNGSKPKTFELEENDPTWIETAGEELGAAMDANLKVVQQLKKEKEQDRTEDQAEALMRVMESATEQSDRHRFAATHTTLHTRLSDVVKDGKLDEFSGVGMAMLRSGEFEEKKIAELVKGRSDEAQRLRLALVHYLLCEDEDSREKYVKEFEKEEKPEVEGETAQTSLGNAFKYLKKIRSFTVPRQEKGRNAGMVLGKKLFNNAVRAVKGSEDSLLPHTKLVDAVLGARSDDRSKVKSELDCVDPKTGQTLTLSSFEFNTAMLFVIGGGNYTEFEDLKQWEALPENRDKTVVYGATELVTGTDFLKQLAELGKE